jgi:hypothetical protein
MWDIKEKRITNERVRRVVANSPTMESMTEMRRCRWLSKLIAMEESRSPRRMLSAWCTTPRQVGGRPQQTIRHAYITTLKKLGFEEGKGKLREWMNVRDKTVNQLKTTVQKLKKAKPARIFRYCTVCTSIMFCISHPELRAPFVIVIIR